MYNGYLKINLKFNFNILTFLLYIIDTINSNFLYIFLQNKSAHISINNEVTTLTRVNTIYDELVNILDEAMPNRENTISNNL